MKNARSNIWVFPNIGVGPQNGWCMMENPINMMIWGYHYFWKHPYQKISNYNGCLKDYLLLLLVVNQMFNRAFILNGYWGYLWLLPESGTDFPFETSARKNNITYIKMSCLLLFAIHIKQIRWRIGSCKCFHVKTRSKLAKATNPNNKRRRQILCIILTHSQKKPQLHPVKGGVSVSRINRNPTGWLPFTSHVHKEKTSTFHGSGSIKANINSDVYTYNPNLSDGFWTARCTYMNRWWFMVNVGVKVT